jgi:molecular chaperone DnaK
MAAYNKTLGKFQLVGIPTAPRGMPQVEVTFDIDANGILNVSATDKGTGQTQQVRIEGGSGLSEEEIQQMVKDAEANADADKNAKDLVEAKNTAEQLLHQTEKTVAEHGEKVDGSVKEQIEAAAAELRTALEGTDPEAIRQKATALQEASYSLAEQVYKEAQQSAPAGDGATASADDEADEEIIEDAEVVDPDATARS